MISDLIVGLSAAVLLGVIYYGFQFQWPGAYQNLADTFGLKVTERAWRLFAFRAVPVFLVGILAWNVAHRLKGTGWLAVSVMLVIHVAWTNGRAFLRSITPGRPEATINYGSYHATAGLVAALTGVVSSFAAPHLTMLIPSRESMVDGFWTALLVATAAGFVLRVIGTDDSNRDPKSIAYWEERARRDASIDTFDALYEIACAERADPLVVKSFAIMEILQRPAWFRRIERLIGIVRPRGSYGVMQETASRPISDDESIRRFSKRVSNDTFFEISTSRYASPKSNKLWGLAGRHNGDKGFYDGVEQIYEGLLYRINWTHLEGGVNPIGIVELRRYPTTWGVRIMTTADKIVLSETDSGHCHDRVRPEAEQSDGWWSTEIRCAIETESIQVFEPGDQSANSVPLRVDSF